jgi:hypothetical protein
MTDQHPITPPLELVQQWGHNANLSGVPHNDEHWAYEQHIATRSAQWGADQQLAEDAKWLDHNALNEPHLRITPVGESLKEAMRPKPPSLKEQALQALRHAPGPDYPNPITLLTADEHALIRRALEALPE